jgi:hypothetical protein
MSTGEIARTIAGLIQQQGADRARSTEALGAVYGGALRDIGQTAQQTIAVATDPKRLELRRQAQAREALTGILKTTPVGSDGAPDHATIAKRLGQAGFPDYAEAYTSTAVKNAESLSTLDKMKRDAAKAVQDLQAHTLATVGDAAFHADTPEKFLASVGYLAAHGQLDETTANGVLDQAQQAGPDGWKSVRETFLQHSPAWLKQQEELRKPVKVGENEKVIIPATHEVIAEGGVKPLVVPEGSTVIDPVSHAVLFTGGQKALDEFQTFKQSYPKTLGKTDWVSLTPEQQVGALGKYAESKADPALRAAALAQKNLAELMAKAQLDAMPTPAQAASVAEDLVAHRIAPEQLASLFSTRGKEGLAFKLAVTSEAKKLQPDFNFEEASSNYNLVKSPGFQNTVRYMDSVQESMPRLLDAANKLGRGSFRSWNALQNAAANQFNSVDLKKLKTDALLVGDEVAKILSGGGSGSATSDAKLKQAIELISASDSVPALAAALGEIDALIGYRRKALTRGTYMEGTSAVKPAEPPPQPKLTPGLQGLAAR